MFFFTAKGGFTLVAASAKDCLLAFCQKTTAMASNKTTGSLSLIPMNSANNTAADAGVSNSDIDCPTINTSNIANNNTIINLHPGIAEEDIIPPFDSAICNNNSLINDKSVLLGAPKQHTLETNENGKEIELEEHEDNKIDTNDVTNVRNDDNAINKFNVTNNDHINTNCTAATEETSQLSKSSSSELRQLTNQSIKQISHSDLTKVVSDLNINCSNDANNTTPSSNTDNSNGPTEKFDSNNNTNGNNISLFQQKVMQRQLFEQQLEKKKMEHFKEVTGRGDSTKSDMAAKSMSPMSPKTTIQHKLNQPSKEYFSAKALVQNPPIMNNNKNHLINGNTVNNNINNNTSSLSVSIENMTTSHQSHLRSSRNNLPSNNTNLAKPNMINNIMNDVDTQPPTIDSSNINNNSTRNSALPQSRRTQSPFRDPSNLYLKQINDQQRPLYTPAVLRVMKHTSSASTLESGFDVHKMPNDFPKLSKNGSTMSVRSTASSIRDYWNYLTGNTKLELEEGPTRKHWKPDSSRFNCFQCGKLFNYLTDSRRKHHCRSCGEIFCGDCLKNYIYLDENAEFTLFGSNWDNEYDNEETENDTTLIENERSNEPDVEIFNNTNLITKKRSDAGMSSNKKFDDEKKYLCKVCHGCFQKYEEYVLDHTTRDHNLGADGKDIRKKERRNTIVDGQNVPVDWNWSSF